jgi:hypothetical protein
LDKKYREGAETTPAGGHGAKYFLEKCESFDQTFKANSILKFYLKILCVFASLRYVFKNVRGVVDFSHDWYLMVFLAGLKNS